MLLPSLNAELTLDPKLLDDSAQGSGGREQYEKFVKLKPKRAPKDGKLGDSAAKPIFRLLPTAGELSKLEAKSKARQRNIVLGGGAESTGSIASRRHSMESPSRRSFS